MTHFARRWSSRHLHPICLANRASAGEQPRRACYYAFGETRLSTGNMITDRLYTGQRWIAELGIYHFNARFYSPKLGRFLSADTMMSGISDPRNLNPFSYAANNPLRYTDPTGHMICEVCGGEGGDFPNGYGYYPPPPPPPDDDEEYQPPVTDPKTDPEPSSDPKAGDSKDSTYLPYEPWNSWTTASYPWSFPVYNSWGDQGPMEINPVDFEHMLKAVGDDLQGFPTLGWYDTPFYDAGGKLTGIGCIYGSCYDRSELNYIGEGMALAKMGFSRESTQNIVWAWKNKGPFVLGLLGLDSTTRDVSQGTIDMTNIGWDYYTENYTGAPYSEPGP